MFMKSYISLFLLSCILLASASPTPWSDDQELSSRGLDVNNEPVLLAKRQNSESIVTSLVRKMVESETYIRSLFRKRAIAKNAKQIKAMKKHDKAMRKHDKAVAKHDAAVAKHDKAMLKLQGAKKKPAAGKPQAGAKKAAKPQGKGNNKALVKNNKKKSAASALEPPVSMALLAKVLAVGGGALGLF